MKYERKRTSCFSLFHPHCPEYFLAPYKAKSLVLGHHRFADAFLARTVFSPLLDKHSDVGFLVISRFSGMFQNTKEFLYFFLFD